MWRKMSTRRILFETLFTRIYIQLCLLPMYGKLRRLKICFKKFTGIKLIYLLQEFLNYSKKKHKILITGGCLECSEHWSCKNDSVFVLGNTGYGSVPVIFTPEIDFIRYLDDFQWGQDTGNYRSCATVYKGNMFVFGGFDAPRRGSVLLYYFLSNIIFQRYKCSIWD